MTRAKTKWLNSFFIFSSFSNQKLVDGLLDGAMQAFLLRDKARQRKAGERLIELSPRFEHIGRCHVIISGPADKWTQGSGELARDIEQLINESPLHVRPTAMNALAPIYIHAGNDEKLATQILFESSKLSMDSGNLITFIQAQSQLSAICSIKGNHQESLDILRGLQPFINRLSASYDVVKIDFYNSVAYELNLLGKHDAAKRFASLVVGSKYLKIYPEWQATLSEVFVKQEEKLGVVWSDLITPRPTAKVLKFKLKTPFVHPPAPTKKMFLLSGSKLQLFDEVTDADIIAVSELLATRRKQKKAEQDTEPNHNKNSK